MALPETTQKPYHGFPSWRVAGKIFANLPDDRHMHLMLSEEAIRAAVASNPAACGEQWWGKKLMALRVSLAYIDAEALQTLLADAWRHRAPRKLISETKQS